MSSSQRVVSDTSPLISLEKIDGGYDFIRRLYENILIPSAVLWELTAGSFDDEDAYLAHFGVADLFLVEDPEEVPLAETRHLDPGEQDAIALATERKLPLMIEEEAGRRVARELGLDITGVAGQILRGVRERVIRAEEGHRYLNELWQKGRINRRVFESVKTAINEET